MRVASTTPSVSLVCHRHSHFISTALHILYSIDSFAASGEVYTWGFNREGQLGVGHDTDDVAVPTEVEGFKKKLVRVFAGLDYSMALTGNNEPPSSFR